MCVITDFVFRALTFISNVSTPPELLSGGQFLGACLMIPDWHLIGSGLIVCRMLEFPNVG